MFIIQWYHFHQHRSPGLQHGQSLEMAFWHWLSDLYFCFPQSSLSLQQHHLQHFYRFNNCGGIWKVLKGGCKVIFISLKHSQLLIIINVAGKLDSLVKLKISFFPGLMLFVDLTIFIIGQLPQTIWPTSCLTFSQLSSSALFSICQSSSK